MPRNRRGRLVAAVLTALVLAASCGGGGGGDETADDAATDGSSSTTSTTTTTTVPGGPFAPFTGEEIADRAELADEPAVVVKIGNNRADNSVAGLIGLDTADIVVEERIEANATRFLAIFHSEIPEEVGPVRSARTTDVKLLSALGSPLLVYSGANGGVQGQLNRTAGNGDVVLVVDDGYGVNLYRNLEYRAPVNLFADPVFLVDKFGEQAGSPTPIVSFNQGAGDPRPTGETAPGVSVSGEYEVAFVHVPGTGYVRVQGGEVHATREGVPLVADNVMVLETRYEPSRIDPESIDAITTGWGRGTILIDGEMWVGTWERHDRTDQYRVIHRDGSEILLDPGTTWIILAKADTYDFEIDPEIAEVAAVVEG